jgi:hypothetical protein
MQKLHLAQGRLRMSGELPPHDRRGWRYVMFEKANENRLNFDGGERSVQT